MPQVYRLEDYNPVLKDVSLIVGDGLCSNIYVIGKKDVTLVDTGVGNRMNPIFPQLEELGFKPSDVKQVIITHTHHDHASGMFRILDEISPRVISLPPPGSGNGRRPITMARSFSMPIPIMS